MLRLMAKSTPTPPATATNPTSAPPRAAPPAAPSPAKPSLKPHQPELYPIDVTKVMPPVGGADSACTGTGRDGMKYNIKTVAKAAMAPGAEWFCHHLAEIVQIAAAHPAVLTLPGDATPAYGSRWESGMLPPARNSEVMTGKLNGEQLPERFSALYAFDLFVHNVDRHPGNYVFIEIDGLYRLLAMDFSRAWTYHGWPLPALPMAVSSSTVVQGRIVRHRHAFEMPAAEQVLEAVERVTLDAVQSIFNRMPGQWLDDVRRAAIARWWTDGSMKQRVAEIRKGLGDGTYL
jgi:signal recognition particle subunit SEC65